MFLQDSEGRLHAGRIGGVLYAIGLAPGCIHFHVDAYCYAGAAFVAGWWLCFGEKRWTITFREMFRPLKIIGMILILLGLAGQFYFAGHRYLPGQR